ncbi:MAG: DNA-processing protein DprA [Candidatus Shapirobacteria bacterium]|jgi:predicted Rossmann fold nucleotide-binding protein DprA/Smf involved in DNA uptake|nr:DNA-processing protein DprA [Candidatus Shapirobacteria bacterium]
MKKIAIVGSRYMSDYGKEVIGKIMKVLQKEEVVTIKVTGCNSEIIRMCQRENIKLKVFEGENFQKLNEQVANYADILIIIEGGENSGTILLASKFVEKNKDVYCVPGRITDKGSFATNWLIKEGAIPLLEIDNLTLPR